MSSSEVAQMPSSEASTVATKAGRRRRRRGSGWTPKAKKSSNEAGPGPGRRPASAEEPAHKKTKTKVAPTHRRGDALIDALNSCEWSDYVLEELRIYANNGMLEKAKDLLNTAPVSTYLARADVSKDATRKLVRKEKHRCGSSCNGAQRPRTYRTPKPYPSRWRLPP